MSACIQCGGPNGEDLLYACVTTERETSPADRWGWYKRVTRETLTEIKPYAVCPDCARKAKTKAVLMTIPITLIGTVVLAVLSWFVAKPNRNIRKEITAYPVVLPAVAVILWVCGLSVYLPRPKELYAAEIVHKQVGMNGSSFLLPLEVRCYTRRKSGVLKPEDIKYKSPMRTELADQLIPVIRGEADEVYTQALIGQTFIKEEDVRRR